MQRNLSHSVVIRKKLVVSAGLAGLLLLGACDSLIYGGNPTTLTTGRVETYRDQFDLTEDTAALSDGKIQQISRDYWSRGETPLQLVVTYDPQSSSNTAMKASQEMGRMTTALKNQGVRQIEADILPVKDSGDVSKTLISYDALNARPPSECDEPMDMTFADPYLAEDYALGCTVHTYVSRQIARPKDLLGNDTMDNNDGRKNANGLETYMGGAPNPELKGERASE